MGYTTEFSGNLYTNKPVTDEFMNYINRFARIRHMKRDEEKIKLLYPDWAKYCFRYGELGDGGQYFVGGDGMEYTDKSILEINYPAPGVPGLWCQWIMPTNSQLTWDDGEKFYDYVEWLEYLIEHFFTPSGYVLNGEIAFQGEDVSDFGVIRVEDNVVDVVQGYHEVGLENIDTDQLITELVARGCSAQVASK